VKTGWFQSRRDRQVSHNLLRKAIAQKERSENDDDDDDDDDESCREQNMFNVQYSISIRLPSFKIIKKKGSSTYISCFT
jgi:hypothetical protein